MPNTTVTQTSKQWTVGLKDLGESLIVAIITPVIPIINATITAGSLTFPWRNIGVAALSGFVGWLTMKFITPSKTVITGTTEGTSINVTAPPAGTSKSVNIAPSIPPTTKP
jgi:hypothetical protein